MAVAVPQAPSPSTASFSGMAHSPQISKTPRPPETSAGRRESPNFRRKAPSRDPQRTMLIAGEASDVPGSPPVIGPPQGGPRMASHLRVYPESENYEFDVPPATVCLRLGDLLPLLAMAKDARYAWLKDF